MLSKIKRRLGYLSTRDGREFLRLWWTCARRARYMPLSDVRFSGLTFDVPDAPSFFWQYVDIFRDQSYFFKAETSAPVIYDCGANIGMSVAWFKRHYPDARVVAFEADETIYDHLCRNLERNGLMEGVVLHNAAVWTDHDGVSFAPDGADGGHVSSLGGTKVPSIALRAMLEAEPRIDFLKMDIEGAEMVVVPDIQPVMKKVRYFFCEYHCDMTRRGGHVPLGRILSILDQEGFDYVLTPVGIHAGRPFEDSPSVWQANIFAKDPAKIEGLP